MKKFLLVMLSSATLYSCVTNPEGKKADTNDSVATVSPTGGNGLAIDTNASSIAWLGNKITGKHNGTIKLSSGNLFVQDGKLTGGKFTINMTTIHDQSIDDSTYKANLEGHLKSPDFFDVAKYPEAVFEITSVQDSANAKLKIAGNLTLRGVSKNISFDADVLESSPSSFKAKADFNINRHDWGITYPGKKDDAISNEINLKVDLQAKS